MKNFYYTKKYELMQGLGTIDELRKDLILLTISPKDELHLRWNGIVNFIYYSFKLNGINTNRSSITQLLSPLGKKKLSSEEELVVRFKKGLDYIFFNWNLNEEQVTDGTIKDLFEIVFNEYPPVQLEDIKRSLIYIQAKTEHPLIQAILAHIIFFDMFPPLSKYKLFSNLIFLLFMYKNGFSFRGFTSVEKEFVEGKTNYKEMIYDSIKQENITECIEYIVRSLRSNLTSVINEVKEKTYHKDISSSMDLNDRQKGILALLDNPQVSVSNKKVQQIFNVSQITASRDLSYLTSLGLLFSIGKGRSTYYTKV